MDEKHLGETIEEIVAIIKGEFPEARAAVAGWFRSYFRIKGTPEQIVTVLEDTGRTRTMLETTIERWKQQGVEEGLEKGLEKGRQEGLQQATLALRLLRRGRSAADVAETTGLPLSQVTDLATEVGSTDSTPDA